MESKLNVGCGRDIRSGYVNLDSAALPGVDVVHDIESIPLPFESSTFSEIVCQDILEHVDLVPVLRDLHRILVPGGRLRIRSPHFTSRNFYVDPTHRRAFSSDTFRFFSRESLYGREYYFDFAFTEVESVEITFGRDWYEPWNPMIRRLVNRSRRTQAYYELTFVSRLFPAVNIEVDLVK